MFKSKKVYKLLSENY